MSERVTIVGGGLAGAEAAWQLARHGVPVDLYEMRPGRGTAAHHTDRLGELVCSNSFRNATLETAVGLLKDEMRRLGSLVMHVADANQVPAGACLAVDRDHFAAELTRAVEALPAVRIVRDHLRWYTPILHSLERDSGMADICHVVAEAIDAVFEMVPDAFDATCATSVMIAFVPAGNVARVHETAPFAPTAGVVQE